MNIRKSDVDVSSIIKRSKNKIGRRKELFRHAQTDTEEKLSRASCI